MVIPDSKDIGLSPLDGLFKMDYMDWQIEKAVPEYMLQINPIENNPTQMGHIKASPRMYIPKLLEEASPHFRQAKSHYPHPPPWCPGD